MTIGPAIPLDVMVAKIVAGSKALVSPLASSVSLPTRRIDGACSLPAGIGLLAQPAVRGNGVRRGRKTARFGGYGPWKPYITPVKGTLDAAGNVRDLNGDGKVNYADASTQAPTTLVDDAHKAGLFMHAHTFRNEQRRLAFDYTKDPNAEYLQFYRLGLDGVFSHFPDTARRQARAAIGAAHPGREPCQAARPQRRLAGSLSAATARMRSTWSKSTGLVRWWSKPASRARCRSASRS